MTRAQKIEALHESMGTPHPMLNDVLRWYSDGKKDAQSNFMVKRNTAYFSDYSKKGRIDYVWDLEYMTINAQSDELIEFLHELI